MRKRSQNAKNKKEEDTYLKLLSKRSRSSREVLPSHGQLGQMMSGIKLQHHIIFQTLTA
jgi:hypothetical protein